MNLLEYCNNIEMLFGLLETCSNTLNYFQQGLQAIIDEIDLNFDKLIAMSNDYRDCLQQTKGLIQLTEKLIQTNNSDDAIKNKLKLYLENFELNVNKGFAHCLKKSSKRMAFNGLESTFNFWKISEKFLDIHLVDSLKSSYLIIG
jgi:hypothetical protein